MTKALLVLSALAAAALLGIRDASTARDSAPTFRGLTHLIPDYPGAIFHAASDGLHLDGTQRFMAYAITDDAPDQILKRYRGLFEDRGLTVTAHAYGVTARANEDDWLRSIAVLKRDGTTTIVASISRAGEPRSKSPLPKPETCVVIESAGARDNGVTRETVSLQCEGFLDDVVDFYDALMSHADTQDDHAGTLTMRTYETAKGEHMTLIARQDDDSPPRVGVSLYWEAR